MKKRVATDKLEFGLILNSVHRELEPYDPHVHDEYQRKNEETRARYRIRLKVVFGPEGADVREGENALEIILGEGYDGTDNAWFCELQRSVDISLDVPSLKRGVYHNVQ